jgi:hypothetical protein
MGAFDRSNHFFILIPPAMEGITAVKRQHPQQDKFDGMGQLGKKAYGV